MLKRTLSISLLFSLFILLGSQSISQDNNHFDEINKGMNSNRNLIKDSKGITNYKLEKADNSYNSEGSYQWSFTEPGIKIIHKYRVYQPEKSQYSNYQNIYYWSKQYQAWQIKESNQTTSVAYIEPAVSEPRKLIPYHPFEECLTFFLMDFDTYRSFIKQQNFEITFVSDVQYEGDTCYLLERRPTDGFNETLKFWIDPKKGYSIVKIEDYTDGKLTFFEYSKVISYNLGKDILWFPSTTHKINYDTQGNIVKQDQYINKDVSFNIGLTGKDIDVVWPTDTDIFDKRTTPSETFTLTKPSSTAEIIARTQALIPMVTRNPIQITVADNGTVTISSTTTIKSINNTPQNKPSLNSSKMAIYVALIMLFIIIVLFCLFVLRRKK